MTEKNDISLRPSKHVEDIEKAHEAAKLTNNLINTLGIKKGQRNKFAENVGPVAVSQAERITDLERDKVTGLHLDRISRKRVAKRLQAGETGCFLVLDMIGLKHLNTFSHQHGDQGLRKIATTLKDFGFDEIGRKGDEFYCYASGKTEAEIRQNFQIFLETKTNSGNLTLPINGQKLELLNYWDCANVISPDDLDFQINQLDSNVEHIKTRVRDNILKQIENANEDQQLELKMLYHNYRRRAGEKDIATMFSDEQWDTLKRKYGVKGPKDIIAKEVLAKIPKIRRTQFYKFEKKALTDAL